MKTADIEKSIQKRVEDMGWTKQPNEDLRSLMEEVGELSREIRRIETGRQRPDEVEPSSEDIRKEIASEIGDIFFPLVKIASYYGITLEESFRLHETKMNERYASVTNNDSVSELVWQTWIEKAESIATEAHKGQVDKGGHDYINHPKRVADRMDKPEEKIVAWLHDVVEDTPWTLEDLRKEGFPSFIVEAIDAITKRDDENREAYLYRVTQNPLARRVKRDGDLQENKDISRIPNPTEKDYDRLKWYAFSEAILEGAGTTHFYGETFGGKKWIKRIMD